MIIKKMAFLFMLIFFSVIIISAQKNNTQQTIKIGYLPITHALPLFIENDIYAGSMKKCKMELIRFGSWPELLDALNTGHIDAASVLIELAMKSKELGIDLKTVALGHRDGNVIVVSNDINKVTDLKDKNFAIPHRLSTHNLLLYKFLKSAGLNYTDVKVIELPPPEMPAALWEKRISGYAVAEPFGAKSVVSGKGKVLFESQDIWKDSVCCGLVIRNDYIKKNTEAAREFVTYYLEAGNKAELKDNKVKEISIKYLKIDKETLDISLKWISYRNLMLQENDYNELIKLLLDMRLVKNPPEYSDFVDNSLIGSNK